MVWGALLYADVCPWCFIKSRINAAIYQEVLEHIMLPSANKLYRDADFLFQQDIALAHSAKSISNWFVTVLDWLANQPITWPEPSLKRKRRDTRSNNTDELKAPVKATWASVTTKFWMQNKPTSPYVDISVCVLSIEYIEISLFEWNNGKFYIFMIL